MSTPVFTASPSTNPYSLTNVNGASAPVFVDIDNDGDLDAFIGNNWGNTLYYRNDGTARNPLFAARVTNPFGLADVGTSAKPTFADIDYDGDADLFISDLNGKTSFYRNTGSANSPQFVVEQSGSNFPFGFGSQVAGAGNGLTRFFTPSLADIDNDGDLDGFMGNWDGKVVYYLYTPSNVASIPPFSLDSSIALSSTGASNATPTFADIDEDGDLDAIVGYNNGNILLFKNNGTATAPNFKQPNGNPQIGTALVSRLGSFTRPTFADIDNDHDLDLFVGNISGNTLLYRNDLNTAPIVAVPLSNQSATKNAAFNYVVPANSFSDIDVGDSLSYSATLANGSALPAWLSFNATTRTFSGTPSNAANLNIKVTATDSFLATVSSSFNLTVSGSVSVVDHTPITDFNADGKSDLFWQHADGSVYAMLLNGAAFASGAIVYGGLSADWQTLNSQGDYNGDGKSDLLFWNTATRSAWISQMNGSAVSSEGYVSYAQNLSTGWGVADSTADYNNDGKSDFLWWNSDTSTAFIALHNGATLTAEATLFGGITGWAIQSAGGDYNGDGNDDILFWNASSNSLYMTTMNGTTISSQALISGGLTGWTVAAALGDFNADGKSDILWRNAASGEVWQYQMNGTSILSSASVGVVNTSWQIVSAHNDFNGDGKADILWKNSDGSAGISLMDGMSMGAITNLGAYAGWTVQNADNDVNADGKADLLWTKTDGAAYVMEMDGVSIIGSGQLGAYSGWSVLV